MYVTMDMCSGTIERDEYDSEVMCAGWNPAVPVIQAGLVEHRSPLVKPSTLPADMAEIEIDAFLHQMYLAQQ